MARSSGLSWLGVNCGGADPGPLAILLVVVLPLVVACARAPDRGGEAVAPPPADLVWPRPPETARIRYVRSITGPGDAGITKSIFRRLGEVLFGATEEGLVRPTGVAERDGVLYIADAGGRALVILDARENRALRVTRLDGAPLASPVAVAPAGDGGVYVADSYWGKVFLVGREGKLLRTIEGAGLKRPAALAFDEGAKRLYVADSATHRIHAYSPDGTPLLAWGQPGYAEGELNSPSHLSVDREGTILVTDALNFRVQAFDRDGKFLWKFGRQGDTSGDFAAPKGIGSDTRGRLYLVDALFDTVQIFDRQGHLLLAFGERGIQVGQFWLPGGLFINGQDRIYVADAYNRRIQVFEYVGPHE